MRRGYTLLEQLVVLTVFAILLTIVGPRTLTALDRSAVRGNPREVRVAAIFEGEEDGAPIAGE